MGVRENGTEEDEMAATKTTSDRIAAAMLSLAAHNIVVSAIRPGVGSSQIQVKILRTPHSRPTTDMAIADAFREHGLRSLTIR